MLIIFLFLDFLCMTESIKLHFIGLGAMGGHMAGHLGAGTGKKATAHASMYETIALSDVFKFALMSDVIFLSLPTSK